ncbi:hypothetical protein MMC17_010252 [Xylographa soralifera]|nr:hypothetical protein [Xylographa soralifera]
MTDIGQKIDNTGFMWIASSVMLGIAIILSVARMHIKISKFHRLFSDDWLFLSAVCFLVAGTTAVFLAVPYNQIELNVVTGTEAAPLDFAHQLDLDDKVLEVANFFLNASVFSVKFSFLLFFRRLLERTGKLQRYWWFTFILSIPSAIVCICIEFVVCPVSGVKVVGKSNSFEQRPSTQSDALFYTTETCMSGFALKRKAALFYTQVTLDIFLD